MTSKYRLPSYNSLSKDLRYTLSKLRLHLVWEVLDIKEDLLISNLDDQLEAEYRLLEELRVLIPVDEEVVDSAFQQDIDNRLIDWPIPFKGFAIDWALWGEEVYDEFLPLLYFLDVVPAWAKNGFDQQVAEFWLLYHDSPWCPLVPDLDYPSDAEEVLGRLQPPWNGLKVAYQILMGDNENPFLDSCGICGEGTVMEFAWSPQNLMYLRAKYEAIKQDLDAFIAYRNVWYTMNRYESQLEAIEKIVQIILEA